MARYLPLIVSTVVVAILSCLYYARGTAWRGDKWIAAEVTISIAIALVSAAMHTRVWTIRNAGVTWLMIGTLLLYGGIAAELWNFASGLDNWMRAAMRASLVVSGPLMIYGVIQYNREPMATYADGQSEGYAAGVAQEQHDQFEREVVGD
jgi:hypothetical protein